MEKKMMDTKPPEPGTIVYQIAPAEEKTLFVTEMTHLVTSCAIGGFFLASNLLPVPITMTFIGAMLIRDFVERRKQRQLVDFRLIYRGLLPKSRNPPDDDTRPPLQLPIPNEITTADSKTLKADRFLAFLRPSPSDLGQQMLSGKANGGPAPVVVDTYDLEWSSVLGLRRHRLRIAADDFAFEIHRDRTLWMNEQSERTQTEMRKRRLMYLRLTRQSGSPEQRLKFRIHLDRRGLFDPHKLKRTWEISGVYTQWVL